MDSSDKLNSSQTVNKLIDIITGVINFDIYAFSKGNKNKKIIDLYN